MISTEIIKNWGGGQNGRDRKLFGGGHYSYLWKEKISLEILEKIAKQTLRVNF